MQFEDIIILIKEHFPDAVESTNENATPKCIVITSSQIYEVCELLHRSKETYFDTLSCLTGIDNGSEASSMEVLYNLYSIPYDLHLMLSVKLDRAHPVVRSVTGIWRGANWHEREAFDLLGIHFEGHPDLRRILLPNDWEGHPLRKDYVEPELYHGIKVKY